LWLGEVAGVVLRGGWSGLFRAVPEQAGGGAEGDDAHSGCGGELLGAVEVEVAAGGGDGGRGGGVEQEQEPEPGLRLSSADMMFFLLWMGLIGSYWAVDAVAAAVRGMNRTQRAASRAAPAQRANSSR